MNAILNLTPGVTSISRFLFDQAPEALLVYDLDSGRFVDANPAAARLFECELGELLACGPEAFHADPDESLAASRRRIDMIARRVAAGEPLQQEVWVRSAKGAQRCCEMRLVSLGLADRTWLRASYIDVTERYQAQAALHAGNAKLAELAQHRQAVLDNVLEAIITVDANGRIQSFNRAATQIFGYTPDEVIGQNVSLLMPKSERGKHDGYMARYESTRRPRVIGVGREDIAQHKSGHLFPIHLSVSAIEGQGRPSFVGLIRDISAQKEAEQHIERLAYYDTLTGLPNRRLLLDRIALMQRQLSQEDGQALLVIADLDQFKSVNDTQGHAAGDALLREVGKRFADCVGERGLVARLGADEFALLIGELADDELAARVEASAWCQDLLRLSRGHHGLFGQEYRGSASLGVVLFSDGRVLPEDLLAHANIALHQAKAESRDTYRFFDAEMLKTAALRAALLNDLRLALPRQELQLAYQPQVDERGRVLGAEALMRWRHPGRGMVSPAQFIPLAEQSGFIIEIGAWLLQQACATLAQWAAQPQTAELTVAINISATEFRDPDFVASVAKALRRSGVDPRRLKLELTESVLSANLGELADKLRTLRLMGVGLSLDDFGTGYSSISYLRQLPLDQLKIDRSFIIDIETSSRDEAIVRGIVELCKVLGLSPIAEGVETPGQRDKLLDCGCTCFQGYLTGRPMNAAELGELIAAENCTLA